MLGARALILGLTPRSRWAEILAMRRVRVFNDCFTFKMTFNALIKLEIEGG